jgi:hypothetical protein
MQQLQLGEEMQSGQLGMLEASQNTKLQAESDTSMKEEESGGISNTSSSSSSRLDKQVSALDFARKCVVILPLKYWGSSYFL